MKRLFAILFMLASPAWADVTIAPGQRTSVSVSGTVTTGTTFQAVMIANANRTACAIQNTSSHTMYFYVGATASATTSNSMQIAPGGVFYCVNGSIAITDNIAITTSTTGDTFAGFYQN